jgi:uncharacterized protein
MAAETAHHSHETDRAADGSPVNGTGTPAARAGASRRTVLAGGALVAAGVVAGGSPATAAPGTTAGRPVAGPGAAPFAAVPVSGADGIRVPAGHRAEVLARWGDPVTGPAARWRPELPGAAADQDRQVGSHHHGVHFVPLPPGSGGERRGLLVLAHESADEALTDGRPALAMAAQGLTVVAVASGRSGDGAWRTVGSRFNRRVTAATPVAFAGPAAGAVRAAGGVPRGVLAPGALGATPWGTVLAAEENANAFFGTGDSTRARTETEVRYGYSAAGFGRPWHGEDERFDLASSRCRPEQYGWIVEFDPRDPAAAPVKRTALGRFPHGSATVSESAGRITVHSTDAEDGEYLYRFTGSRPWRALRARGLDPLDHGTLSVARLAADGTGEWVPLVHGRGPLTRENGWRDQADVLVRARLAADAVGATPLARPERTALHPGGDLYVAVAGGSGGGGCGAPGSRSCAPAALPHGGVLRIGAASGDAAGAFTWEVFLTGADPRHPGGAGHEDEGAFAHPKGLWFDPAGLLWISTGIPGRLLDTTGDGGPGLGNNALLVADPETGRVRRFLTAPRGAEVTGVSAAPGGGALFVNIQHPGRRTASGAPGKDSPGAVSTWPERTPGARPRSATVVITRD